MLKDCALFIRDILESKFNITIPKLFSVNNSSLQAETNYPSGLGNGTGTKELEDTGKLFSTIGIILLGIISFIGILVVTDHYAPESVSKIPYINYILDPIYNSYNYIHNWFYGNPGPDSMTMPPATGGNTEAISRTSSGSSLYGTEAISRNSSGGGSITPTLKSRGLQNITPPISRNGTPVPEYTDNFNNTTEWE